MHQNKFGTPKPNWTKITHVDSHDNDDDGHRNVKQPKNSKSFSKSWTSWSTLKQTMLICCSMCFMEFIYVRKFLLFCMSSCSLKAFGILRLFDVSVSIIIIVMRANMCYLGPVLLWCSKFVLMHFIISNSISEFLNGLRFTKALAWGF